MEDSGITETQAPESACWVVFLFSCRIRRVSSEGHSSWDHFGKFGTSDFWNACHACIYTYIYNCRSVLLLLACCHAAEPPISRSRNLNKTFLSKHMNQKFEVVLWMVLWVPLPPPTAPFYFYPPPLPSGFGPRLSAGYTVFRSERFRPLELSRPPTREFPTWPVTKRAVVGRVDGGVGVGRGWEGGTWV